MSSNPSDNNFLPNVPNPNDPPEPNPSADDNSRNSVPPPPTDFSHPGTPGPSRHTPSALEEPIPDWGNSSLSQQHQPQQPQISDIPSEPSLSQASSPPPGPSRYQQPNDPPEPIVTNLPRSQPSHPSDPIEFGIDPQILQAVLETGFDEYIAQIAIRKTNGVSAEAAIEWIIDHSNQSDLEDSGSDSDEESTDDENEMDSMVAHKMVFVANMTLKMGSGKLAAQVGHGCLGLYRKISKTEEGQRSLKAWRRHGEMKVVVRGQNDEQLFDLLKQAKDNHIFAYLVHDAGHTQVPAGSRTILGIFGPSNDVDKVTGSLKLL